MKLNKRLLRKVRNRIAEIPESYNQNYFWLDDRDAPCGTVACLAGETIIASKPTVQAGIKSLRRYSNECRLIIEHPIARRAAKLLGLTDDERRIFDGVGNGWPQPYKGRFQRASTPNQRAQVAVAYLDECLKRGKVMW